MKKHISLAASALLVSGLVFTGCFDNDGTTSSSNSSSTSTVTGLVIDGYVSGATLSLSGSSATTDTNGSFTMSINTVNVGDTISSTGGKDVTTGEDFNGTLKAISQTGTTVILTPLTTMVAEVLAADSTQSSTTVESKLKTALGISSSYDFNTDPTTDPSTNATALKAMLQVQKFAEVFDSANLSSSSASLLMAQQIVNNNVTDINTTMENVIGSVSASADQNTSLKIVKTQLESIQTSDVNTTSGFDSMAKAIEVANSNIKAQIENNASGAALFAKASAVTGLKTLANDLNTTSVSTNDLTSYSTSFFNSNVLGSANTTYTQLETATTGNDIYLVLANVSANADKNITTAISDVNSSLTTGVTAGGLTNIQSTEANLTTQTNTATTAAATAAAAAGTKAFSLSGIETKVQKTGDLNGTVTVTGGGIDFSTSFNNFASIAENNTSTAKFGILITSTLSGRSGQTFAAVVDNVQVVKYSDTNISVTSPASSSTLTFVGTRVGGSELPTLTYSNPTSNLFETNSTGGLDANFTTAINNVRNNTSFSDYNSSVEQYLNESGNNTTYSVKAFIYDSNLSITDFYKSSDIVNTTPSALSTVICGSGATSCVVNAIDGNVTVQ